MITLRPSCGIAELAQPGSESSLDRLGICRCELVFEREGPLCPGGERLRINELLQLGDQPVSQVFGRVRRQARWLGPFRTRSSIGRLRRLSGFELDCGLVEFAGILFGPWEVLLGFRRQSRSGQVGRIDIILAGNPDQGEQGIAAGIGQRGP